MRAGQLRHRLKIQQTGLVEDATGTPGQVWSDVVTVHGRVEPLTGRDLAEAHSLSTRITHRVTIRAFSALTEQHRFKFGTRVLDIISVADLDERGRTMIVMCEEAR